MQGVFREGLESERAGGGAAAFAARAYADLIATAVRERLAAVQRDIAFAVRLILRSPGASLVVIATFAISIGIGTAVFSVISAVLIAPLPYADPGRLVFIGDFSIKNPDSPGNESSLPNIEDWRTMAASSFSNLGSFAGTLFTRTDVNEPEALHGCVVTGGFFTTLGVRAQLGRLIDDRDTPPGAARRVVLSDAYWRRDFNASANAIGKTIRLNGVGYTVVGVLPRGFFVPRDDGLRGEAFDLFRALPRNASPRGSRYLDTFARLAPGVSVAAAQTRMNRVADLLRAQYFTDNSDISERVVDLPTHLFGPARTTLGIAAAGVLAILLIACLNVGNMFLARIALRQREIAVRFAVGASRGRIIRQLLAESTTYAVAGAVIGLLLCEILVRALASFDIATLPRLDRVSIDPIVLLVTLAMTAFSALLTGIVPALTLSQGRVGTMLKAAGRGSSDVRGKIFRAAGVVVELALAIALVSSSALLVRSFIALTGVDVGFSYDRLAASDSIALPSARYPNDASRIAFAHRLENSLRAIPGIENAGLTFSTPLSHTNSDSESLTIVGRANPRGQLPGAAYTAMTSGALQSFGFRLLRGRLFTGADREGTHNVAIVSRTFERRFFPAGGALGAHIRIGFTDQSPIREIVGVVGDFKVDELIEAPQAQVIVPLYQDVASEFQAVTRSTLPPAQLSSALTGVLHDADPLLPARTVVSYGRYIDDRREATLTALRLMSFLAFVALLLAAIGTYGVLAYNVAQRRQEFGIRRALGASTTSIVRSILVQTAAFAAAGIALGFVLCIPMANQIQSLLAGTPVDLALFGSVALTLAVVAFGASIQPALAATRVDPIAVLRYD
jgi:putative ABC transport system permease protein